MNSILLLINFFVFFLGLCVGSFLNVVIYRLEKNEHFLIGRSYCPVCKHQLRWLDLFPIGSFLFLQGKCRYCHAKISLQYPMIELLTGLTFLLVFHYQAPLYNLAEITPYSVFSLCFLWYVVSSLIVIFAYDLKHYLIPDSVLFPAIVVTLFYRFFNVAFLLNYTLAAVIASGFFLGIWALSKGRWMGFGDVKLAVLLGLVLGFPNILVSLFLSFLIGAIIGAILMVYGAKKLKSEVPFAPFLIMGTFIAMLWGNQIIHWYTNLILF